MKKELTVYQLNCKIYLLKDIAMQEVLENTTSMVDVALCKQESMRKFHAENKYKDYCISGIKEIEKDKMYKQGNIYSFSVRCIQKELAMYLQRELGFAYTDNMKGLTCTSQIIPKGYISKLYNLTPSIITTNGYWKDNISFTEYENALFTNAIKKYNEITKEKIDENFKLYDAIQILNRKPIGTRFKKNITLLGDKLELMISSDERAQTIAYMLLGTGLLEKNGRAFGYVNYKSE